MIRRGENPYFVRELKTGYVVIGDHQHFHGYTLFLYKEHGDKTELFHLGKAERALFMEDAGGGKGVWRGKDELRAARHGRRSPALAPHAARQRRPRQLRQSRKGSRVVASDGEDVQRRKPPECR